MLKTLFISTALIVSGAAFAQTPSPGGTMAPPTATPGAAMPPSAMPGAGANGTAPTPTTAPTAPAKLSAADKKFIEKIASANAAEIQAAQLAQQKAGDQKVKDTAQMILTDHTEAGQKLNALAQQKGLTIPTDLDPKDQRQVDKFGKLSGKKFDRTYVKDEIKGHEEVLALLKKESAGGKDPDVKAFADAVTPTIQKHLDMLQNKGT